MDFIDALCRRLRRRREYAILYHVGPLNFTRYRYSNCNVAKLKTIAMGYNIMMMGDGS